MTKLLSYIDFLLSLLPFNGNKTKLGALISLAVSIHQMFPGFDVLSWLNTQLIYLGVPVFLAGLIHKAVKAVIDSQAPELLTQSSAKAVTKVNPVTKAPKPTGAH